MIGVIPAGKIVLPVANHVNPLWTRSKDGKLAIRLVVKTEKVKPGEPIVLAAQLKNLSKKPIHVLRPFGDWYEAQAVGMEIRGRLGKVKYGGPTPGYIIGSSAFYKLPPGKTVEDVIKLDRFNFVGLDIPGVYQMAYQYSYNGEWNYVAKRAGLSTDIWKGNIRSNSVTVEILSDPKDRPWVMSKDGTVGIRLSAKTRPLRKGEPIVLTATIRNFSPKTISVLKPLEFPISGKRKGLEIDGPEGAAKYVGPKAKPETVFSHFFVRLIPGQKYEGDCHLESDSYSGCGKPGKYKFTYEYSSSQYQARAKEIGISNYWAGRLPKATLSYEKPLFSQVKHPAQPGKYANGNWEYELRIFGEGLKHRQGVLKYNGKPIHQPIGTHILTALGRFMSFDTKGGQTGYNQGWHMTVFLHDDKQSNVELPVFLKNGNPNPEVLKALGIRQTKELKKVPNQEIEANTKQGKLAIPFGNKSKGKYVAYWLTSHPPDPKGNQYEPILLLCRLPIEPLTKWFRDFPANPKQIAKQPLPETMALTVPTYKKDSIWNFDRRPFKAVQSIANINPKANEVAVNGKQYRYEVCPIKEVVRLLENPEGKLPLHRLHAPLEGVHPTALALRLLLKAQLIREETSVSDKKKQVVQLFWSQIDTLIKKMPKEAKSYWSSQLNQPQKWMVKRQPFQSAFRRVSDTLTPEERKTLIVRGKLQDINRVGECWAIEYVGDYVNGMAAYVDVQTGRLVFLWMIPEG